MTMPTDRPGFAYPVIGAHVEVTGSGFYNGRDTYLVKVTGEHYRRMTPDDVADAIGLTNCAEYVFRHYELNLAQQHFTAELVTVVDYWDED